MCITLFWYISLPSWHDYDVKLLNFTFCGGRKHKTTTLFFFSQTLIQSFSIQFQKNPPAFEEFKEVEYARLRVWSISNTVFNWRLRIAVAVVAWALYYVKSFTTFDWSVISFLLVPDMVLAKMNIQEHQHVSTPYEFLVSVIWPALYSWQCLTKQFLHLSKRMKKRLQHANSVNVLAHARVNLIRYKSLRKFVHSFDPSLIPFQPRFCKLFGDKYKASMMFLFLYLLLLIELISFPYILSQVTG